MLCLGYVCLHPTQLLSTQKRESLNTLACSCLQVPPDSLYVVDHADMQVHCWFLNPFSLVQQPVIKEWHPVACCTQDGMRTTWDESIVQGIVEEHVQKSNARTVKIPYGSYRRPGASQSMLDCKRAVDADNFL